MIYAFFPNLDCLSIIAALVYGLRYKEGHAVRHWKDTQHWYSLDLRTQQIWDYVGDNYVHRLNQSKADGKLVEMNSPCMSHEAHCGTCECSEDSGISGALFNSKVEAVCFTIANSFGNCEYIIFITDYFGLLIIIGLAKLSIDILFPFLMIDCR